MVSLPTQPWSDFPLNTAFDISYSAATGRVNSVSGEAPSTHDIEVWELGKLRQMVVVPGRESGSAEADAMLTSVRVDKIGLANLPMHSGRTRFSRSFDAASDSRVQL